MSCSCTNSDSNITQNFHPIHKEVTERGISYTIDHVLTLALPFPAQCYQMTSITTHINSERGKIKQ